MDFRILKNTFIYSLTNILLEVKSRMSGKKKRGEEGGSNIDVTVKISGNALKQVIIVRGNRERITGRITSIAELVREAIECWYDREGDVK